VAARCFHFDCAGVDIDFKIRFSIKAVNGVTGKKPICRVPRAHPSMIAKPVQGSTTQWMSSLCAFLDLHSMEHENSRPKSLLQFGPAACLNCRHSTGRLRLTLASAAKPSKTFSLLCGIWFALILTIDRCFPLEARLDEKVHKRFFGFRNFHHFHGAGDEFGRAIMPEAFRKPGLYVNERSSFGFAERHS